MLTHHQPSPAAPARVVIIGAAGFVGRATMKKLASANVPALALTRKDVDLLASDASAELAARLRPDDAVVVIAAKAPAKNTAMVVENVAMMHAVCEALVKVPVTQVIYVSSDAVYADSDSPLSETSCAEPSSLHGAMHLVREVMLASAFSGPLCILRPTLLYGAGDPHNGFGPNSFRRFAAAGKEIVLFGEGEERRDHVFVDDVAEIILRVVLHRSSGKLNVTSGAVTSFREIAERVAALEGGRSAVRGSPRKGPMPHNGYRAFDATATSDAFPDFRYTTLADGLARAREPEADASSTIHDRV